MKLTAVLVTTGAAVGFAFGFMCIYAIGSVAITHVKRKNRKMSPDYAAFESHRTLLEDE